MWLCGWVCVAVCGCVRLSWSSWEFSYRVPQTGPSLHTHTPLSLPQDYAPPNQVSKDFVEFVSLCLELDPQKRPPLIELMKVGVCHARIGTRRQFVVRAESFAGQYRRIHRPTRAHTHIRTHPHALAQTPLVANAGLSSYLVQQLNLDELQR